MKVKVMKVRDPLKYQIKKRIKSLRSDDSILVQTKSLKLETLKKLEKCSFVQANAPGN